MATVPEVRDYQSYAGIAAPIDFTGLARQYYLRDGGEYGTIQVNLFGKHERRASSHEIAARVEAHDVEWIRDKSRGIPNVHFLQKIDERPGT